MHRRHHLSCLYLDVGLSELRNATLCPLHVSTSDRNLMLMTRKSNDSPPHAYFITGIRTANLHRKAAARPPDEQSERSKGKARYTT